jgi:hypothetical protein
MPKPTPKKSQFKTEATKPEVKALIKLMDAPIIENIKQALLTRGDVNLRTGSRRTDEVATEILENAADVADVKITITKHEGHLTAKVV